MSSGGTAVAVGVGVSVGVAVGTAVGTTVKVGGAASFFAVAVADGTAVGAGVVVGGTAVASATVGAPAAAVSPPALHAAKSRKTAVTATNRIVLARLSRGEPQQRKKKNVRFIKIPDKSTAERCPSLR